MSSALLFVALSFAVWRFYRLIGRDDITGPLRGKLVGDGVVRGWLLEGIECPFCLGSWLSLAGVYATHRYLTPLEPHWLLWAVGVAGVVGLLGQVDEVLSALDRKLSE